MEAINNIVGMLNGPIWGVGMLVLIVGSGLYFTIRLGFSSLFISKICGAGSLTSRSLNPVFLHSHPSVQPWRCVLVPVT